MEKIFLTFLEVSAGTGVVILALCLCSRYINRTFVAKWKYWLWLALAVRLLIPLNTDFSAAPARVEVEIPDRPIAVSQNGGRPAGAQVPGAERVPAEPPLPAKQGVTTLQLMTLLWLAGTSAVFLWQGTAYLVFRRRLFRWGRPAEPGSVLLKTKSRVEAEMGIPREIRTLVSRDVQSPMMLGFFSPVLVLPRREYSEEELGFILRHELTHCKRRDIWYKALMLLCGAVHWFNPAVWMMVRCAERDLEISCDAAVMRGADGETRRRYGEAILANVRREPLAGTALSTHFYGGKRTVKERFASILSTRKRRVGAAVFAAVLLCALLVGGLVACGSRPEESPEKASAEEPSSQSQAEPSSAPGDGEEPSVEEMLENITLEAYPHSSEEAIGQFREYIRSLPGDQARMTLTDDALVYSMLMPTYWDPAPENFYAVAATRETYAPDQSMMPKESRWATEADRQKAEGLLARLTMDAVDNVCAISAPNDRDVSTELSYYQVSKLISRLKRAELATCEPQNPNTGGYFSLYLLGPGDAMTIGFNGNMLFIWAEGEESGWIFDGEVCANELYDMWNIVDGVLRPAPVEELPAGGVARYNELFSPLYADGTGETAVNLRCCFLSSYYGSITDMDLTAFLRYFPDESAVTDEAEFAALRAHPDFPFKSAESPEQMPVPVHKFTSAQVDAALREHGGITLDELQDVRKSSPELIYLKEYDAYYNFTSDMGPGALNAVRGEREGDIVRLYSEAGNGERTVLVLFEPGDGRLQIVSHLKDA